MRIRRILPATLATAALVLTGCASGGGGGGGSGGDGGDANTNGIIDDSDTNGTTGDTSSSPSLAASADNQSTVERADAQIERLLAQGADARTVCTELADMLRDDQRVAGSEIDPDLDAVWVDFVDGETQIFQIIDVQTDDEGLIETDTFALTNAARPSSASPSPPPSNGPRQFDPPVFGDLYHMPANNKALLANAIAPFHANWDVTDATNNISFMLSGVGYDPKRTELTLDLVETFGDYAVIVLETHGAWREPIYDPQVIKLPPGIVDQDPDEPINTPNSCGGNGARHILLTTTRVTGENLAPRGADIFCGRLVIWNVHLRQKNGTVTKQANYGFTANYVRQKVSKFPTYSLFVLNACRGFNADPVTGESLAPFQDVLFEKTDQGANFLGWDARVRYPNAYRAILNFFKFATTSDLEETIKNVKILETLEPPWGGWDPNLFNAWAALNEKGYAFDPTSGASLLLSNQPPVITLPILMPYPQSAVFEEDGKHKLHLLADGAPDVRVGDSSAAVTLEPGTNSFWNLTLPVGAFGDITVTENDRLAGITRKVHRWKPQIKITGPSGGLQYTVTLTLYARATIDPSSMRVSMFDDAPTPNFHTYWEKEASFVGWQITGQDIFDNFPGTITVDYAGSGQRALNENENGSFESNDGTTATIDINADVAYTETRTDSQSGEVTTTQRTLDLNLFRTDVPLSASWTVSAQSFTDDIGQGDSQISWNAFSAEPPFDAAAEPR